MNRTGLVAIALFTGAMVSSGHCGADIAVPLPAIDRLAIEQSLGLGVLGESLPAPVIADPRHYLELVPAARTFRIVQGFRAGQDEKFRLLSEPSDAARRRWRYLLGDEEAGFLELRTDGSLVLTGVQDRQSGALTHYEPAEPFLLTGMAPGGAQNLSMAVRVLDAEQPERVLHRGMLAVGYRYVGAYRLVLPAGTYDAVLMKSTYHGQVGPAELDDTQYRFFAPRVGLVAAIEHRQVSAYLLYHSETTTARVLAGKAE